MPPTQYSPTIKNMQSEFRAKWSNRGVKPEMIDMALKNADNWSSSQLNWVTVDVDDTIKEKLRPTIYKKALEGADNWLRGMLQP